MGAAVSRFLGTIVPTVGTGPGAPGLLGVTFRDKPLGTAGRATRDNGTGGT
jgi:hypothetical protein